MTEILASLRTRQHPVDLGDAGGDALDQLLKVEVTAASLADQVRILAMRFRAQVSQQKPSPLLTIAEAARLYRSREQAIRDAIADGRLTAIRRVGRGGRVCHMLRVVTVDAVFGREERC